MFDIEFYQEENGNSPVGEYLDSLPAHVTSKIHNNIQRLQQLGYKAREPLSSPLTNSIFELKTKFGNNEYRILYFFVVNQIIVFVHGFTKKTEKTPNRDKNIAIKRKADYERRMSK